MVIIHSLIMTVLYCTVVGLQIELPSKNTRTTKFILPMKAAESARTTTGRTAIGTATAMAAAVQMSREDSVRRVKQLLLSSCSRDDS
jgi:hypothetical protein